MKPPFEITDAILCAVASISEKVGALSVSGPWETKPHLRKINRIRSVQGSLKIEANSLSLDQVRDVIDGKAVMGSKKEILEVQNAYRAYERLGEVDPYSLKCLRKFHGIMTAGLIDESGVFRSGEEGVFQGHRCIFMAPPAKYVSAQMEGLFDWLTKSRHSVHPLIRSSVFHYEFVFIHPFADGNGRMARLWQTAILSKWKPIFEYIPLESQIERFQQDYYDAIALCHRQGSSTAFVQFMVQQIDILLDATALQLQGEQERLLPAVKRLLDAMEPGKAYSAAELMERMGLKSRESFRKRCLAPALAQNLIERTIPASPKSRNQRYRKA